MVPECRWLSMLEYECLNINDLHEFLLELGGAVPGGKTRIPHNGLDVARNVHIVHFKVIASHDQMCSNQVKLEHIGQFSTKCWIVFGPKRQDRIVLEYKVGSWKDNFAGPDAEVDHSWGSRG